jgi:PDZ domain/Aspartyl protease
MAQMPGVTMPRGAKKVEIPFEWRDNFIILKIQINGFLPLRFILDTGAEHTILTKKEIAGILGMTYERSLTLTGTDMQSQIEAHIVRRVSLELTNLKMVKDILVLEEDYLKLDQFAGLDIHGILGAETFRGFALKIDFIKQVLTVYETTAFKPADRKRFEEIPMEVFRSKPYIKCPSKINKDSVTQLKLLMDTGASLSFLLHTYSTIGLELPERVIKGKLGTGFSGIIEGYVGRIKSLNLGSHKLTNAIANFQELPDIADSVHLNSRHGLIGIEVLSRFTVIFDFANEKLYLQPNRFFKDAYSYDRSGMTLIAHGQGLNHFTIYDIMPNSPAADAQILRGDEIVTINHFPAHLYTLGGINRQLQKKAGKTIRLTLMRNGQKIKHRLKLRDLI